MRTEHILCHTFLPEPLKSARVILDCGSNRGEFARWMSANTPATIHGFEPDPRLFADLPKLPRVHFHPLAIDGECGEFELALGKINCSSAVYRESGDQPTVTVKKTTLDSFCATSYLDEIDLIKIDIEGAELSLLEKTSERTLRRISQITIEFHDFLRSEDEPRIRAIASRLQNFGFLGIRFSHFTWGDCLFVNTRRVPIGWLDHASLQLRAKYVPGIRRFVSRKLGAAA